MTSTPDDDPAGLRKMTVQELCDGYADGHDGFYVAELERRLTPAPPPDDGSCSCPLCGTPGVARPARPDPLAGLDVDPPATPDATGTGVGG